MLNENKNKVTQRYATLTMNEAVNWNKEKVLIEFSVFVQYRHKHTHTHSYREKKERKKFASYFSGYSVVLFIQFTIRYIIHLVNRMMV